jgi:hypothetical protein
VLAAGSFFVGAVREDEPRAVVPEARPFDLVLVAMPSTLRPTADSGPEAHRVSATPPVAPAPPRGPGPARRAGGIRPDQRRARTIVSRVAVDATTPNPSER